MNNKFGYKTTEIGEMPEEWEVVTIEDKRVSKKLQAGGTPLRSIKEYYEKGEIPFVRIEDMTKNEHYLYGTEIKITEKGLENSSAWLVPPNTILFSMYASYGEAVINRIPVATNQAIIAIIPQENVEIEYLYYSLKQLKSKLYRHLRETTQKNLNAEIVRNLKIPFPPFLEQRKIAAILCCVDEAIQKTDEIIQKTQELKKGLMQQLLTKGVGHTKFKQTEIGEIPEEWEVVRLGDVLVDIRYGTSIKSNTVKRGFPVLRIPNVLRGEIDVDDLRWAELPESEKKSLVLKDGDLLIVRTNANPDYIGRCALFENVKGTWVYASYLIRLRPDNRRIFPLCLSKYLQTEAARRSFFGIARTSAGNYNINIKGIQSIRVPLPQLHEQQKISEILSNVDEKIDKERQRKEQLEKLKKGLMQDLLTGRVRVKVS